MAKASNDLIQAISRLIECQTKMMERQDAIFEKMFAMMERQDSFVSTVTATIEKIVAKFTMPASSLTADEEEKRIRSLVFIGVPEAQSKEPQMRETDDCGTIKSMLNDIDCDAVPREIYRMGARKDSSQRPIKVIFANSHATIQVLRNASRLKDHPNYRRVFIRPSLTPEQRQKDFELRQELRKRRQTDPNLIIRNSQIVSRTNDNVRLTPKNVT